MPGGVGGVTSRGVPLSQSFPRPLTALQSFSVGFRALPIRLAVDDEVVGVAGEAIDRALGTQRIGKRDQPFVGAAIRCHDDRAGAMTLGQDLVEVATLGRVECIEGEVVDLCGAPHSRLMQCPR